jgi:hypothetical protein
VLTWTWDDHELEGLLCRGAKIDRPLFVCFKDSRVSFVFFRGNYKSFKDGDNFMAFSSYRR